MCASIWAIVLFVLALTVPVGTNESSAVFDDAGRQLTRATTTGVYVPFLAALLPLGAVLSTWLLLHYRVRWAALALAAALLAFSCLGLLTIGLYLMPLAAALAVAASAPGPRRSAETAK